MISSSTRAITVLSLLFLQLGVSEFLRGHESTKSPELLAIRAIEPQSTCQHFRWTMGFPGQYVVDLRLKLFHDDGWQCNEEFKNEILEACKDYSPYFWGNIVHTDSYCEMTLAVSQDMACVDYVLFCSNRSGKLKGRCVCFPLEQIVFMS